jgi:molybdopterin synthase sulfur carrier subunit
VSAIAKIQITKHKYQTNYNGRNSKSQTIGFWSYLRSGFTAMTISVQVDFHATIRKVFGEKSIQIDLSSPSSVGFLLDRLCTSPERYENIFEDTNRLRSDVTILKNGRNIVFLDGLNTELTTGDKIAIFPPVVGG